MCSWTGEYLKVCWLPVVELRGKIFEYFNNFFANKRESTFDEIRCDPGMGQHGELDTHDMNAFLSPK